MSKYENLKSKIVEPNQLDLVLQKWQSESKQVVFTNGCFDIIHRGHIDYLSKAADLGDVLVVGLNTDASVQRLKGPSRPIQDELSRAMIMAAFSFVDLVVFFDEDTPYNLINQVKPQVLVKGSDYKIEAIVGYDILQSYGGVIKTLDFINGYSTSTIINKIKTEK